MSATLTIGSIRGIPVRVHASWLAVYGLIAWSLGAGYPRAEFAIAIVGPLTSFAIAAVIAVAGALVTPPPAAADGSRDRRHEAGEGRADLAPRDSHVLTLTALNPPLGRGR